MNLNSYSDTMFLALQWAMQDRLAMLDALSLKTDKKAVEAEIRALQRLRRRLFGDIQTREEHFAQNAKAVGFRELLALARSGEIEVLGPGGEIESAGSSSRNGTLNKQAKGDRDND